MPSLGRDTLVDFEDDLKRMKVSHPDGADKKERNVDVVRAFGNVSETYLREAVETIAIPRHALAEPANNRKVAEWIRYEFESFSYRVETQGQYDNVIAMTAGGASGPMILVGAHYDSVPNTPGADDNASAVAAMLACAKALSQLAHDIPVCFVAFNREEDGFLGSDDFVGQYVGAGKVEIRHAHILEMVGYSSDEKGSQQLPPMLPIKVPDTGNFLGILGNSNSTDLVDSILSSGRSYFPDFAVIGLKLYLGAERTIPNVTRSDHVS